MTAGATSRSDRTFDEPVDVIFWASRNYLRAVSRADEVPQELIDTFEEAKLRYFYHALVRVLKRLLATTSEPLAVHEVDCPCVAYHEQVLICGLRALQRQCYVEYSAAMSAILPPSAVRQAHSDMAVLASALSDFERFWPTKPESASTNYADRISLHLH